ncbi:MAG: ribosome hibernation-promoting factor, HPF/YfiA family [Magnetovibrionaceae bacterium]
MDISVKGKNMDVGEALRGHAEDQLAQSVSKYFDRAVDGQVLFAKERSQFRAEIHVHPIKGVIVQGRGEGGDAYGAFDIAQEHIAKQLRRYKRRLTNHHNKHRDDDILSAQRYVIAPETTEVEEVPEEAQPAIIAEMPTSVGTMSVSEAVMRMDLADVSAIMFKNPKHGGLNVVYRRSDGNIGWIDPNVS